MLQVNQVTSDDEIQIVKDIRIQVFVKEQKFALEIEIDENDDLDTTLHYLGWITTETSKEYIAVARCLLDLPNRKAKIGRFAILKEYRGKKYGAALMQAIEENIKARGDIDTLVLSSQYDKREFYHRCGFQYANNQVYLEEGVEHCLMIKQLNE